MSDKPSAAPQVCTCNDGRNESGCDIHGPFYVKVEPETPPEASDREEWHTEGARWMLDQVRASLEHFPDSACDTKIGKSIESLIKQAHKKGQLEMQERVQGETMSEKPKPTYKCGCGAPVEKHGRMCDTCLYRLCYPESRSGSITYKDPPAPPSAAPRETSAVLCETCGRPKPVIISKNASVCPDCWQIFTEQPAPPEASDRERAQSPGVRAYAHKAMDRVQEMRKLDLERANDPAQAKERDYYLGRAHRCDDVLFWLSEAESRLEAGDELASAYRRGQQEMQERVQGEIELLPHEPSCMSLRPEELENFENCDCFRRKCLAVIYVLPLSEDSTTKERK